MVLPPLQVVIYEFISYTEKALRLFTIYTQKVTVLSAVACALKAATVSQAQARV